MNIAMINQIIKFKELEILSSQARVKETSFIVYSFMIVVSINFRQCLVANILALIGPVQMRSN